MKPTRNSELGTRNSELGTRNSELGTRNLERDPEQEIQEPDGLWLGVLIWLHIGWETVRGWFCRH